MPRTVVWLVGRLSLAVAWRAPPTRRDVARSSRPGRFARRWTRCVKRQENTARDLARIQSQLRGLETDAAERTREIRAAGVELARARVLLEEARAGLRERAGGNGGGHRWRCLVTPTAGHGIHRFAAARAGHAVSAADADRSAPGARRARGSRDRVTRARCLPLPRRGEAVPPAPTRGRRRTRNQSLRRSRARVHSLRRAKPRARARGPARRPGPKRRRHRAPRSPGRAPSSSSAPPWQTSARRSPARRCSS